MDDLKLLRDLGEEIGHEPPATLARQRERLLRARPRRRWAGWWTAGLVAVATAGAVAVPAVLVSGRPTAAPPAGSQAVDMSGTRNVLVIGSDTREGDGNATYGPALARQNAGKRSDTIMIVNIPADRGRATVVSVPRDSMVQISRCGSSPARFDMINSAYNTGGVGCLKRTLESLTGLRIQHSVEVDFTGFKGMVDALGGVEVTLPKAVDDKAAKLKLPAGKQLLNGEAALGYVRLRHYGDGSDVQRMKRQQTLVLAMLKKARSGLSSPERLKPFLEEVRKSVKTDLNLDSMYELATELSGTKLHFTTVPWMPYPEDRNRLQWRQPDAAQLFKRLGG
ncbi:LCP family protein [Nonomuraea jabiensis]|uniref:LCP family protein required for cell wall assembly n=1 Tax=Nonomuraea jabiensis TaxID=882448 RepID=A0A7W9LAB5_9ACTN|nr:LCP family protein [Nonomuraea jabiensis]MBB5776441.1 LCP family protein required for cell wall assembly [Nonomuraea jabiensis]